MGTQPQVVSSNPLVQGPDTFKFHHLYEAVHHSRVQSSSAVGVYGCGQTNPQLTYIRTLIVYSNFVISSYKIEINITIQITFKSEHWRSSGRDPASVGSNPVAHHGFFYSIHLCAIRKRRRKTL